MTTSKEITDVMNVDSPIVKIMSGGSILWEKKVVDILNLNDRPSTRDNYINNLIIDGNNVYAVGINGSDKRNFYQFDITDGKIKTKYVRNNIDSDARMIIKPKDSKESVIFTILKGYNSSGWRSEFLCSFDLSTGESRRITDDTMRLSDCRSYSYCPGDNTITMYANREFHRVYIATNGTDRPVYDFSEWKHLRLDHPDGMPYVLDMIGNREVHYVLLDRQMELTPPLQQIGFINAWKKDFYIPTDLYPGFEGNLPYGLTDRIAAFKKFSSVIGLKKEEISTVSDDGLIYILTDEKFSLFRDQNKSLEYKKSQYDIKLENPVSEVHEAICDYDREKIIVKYEKMDYRKIAYSIYDITGKKLRDIKINCRSYYNYYGFDYSDGNLVYTYLDQDHGNNVICCEQI